MMDKTFIEQYRDEIRKGNIIAGYWIKKELDNLIDDLNDDRFCFDTKEAYRRIKFIETCCLQSKKPYYMKPVKLMLWQKAFLEALYAFKMKDSGKRRFTEALLEVARKNGKSTFLAADGTVDLFIGDGGSDIVCASNADKQCRIIWDEIAGMRSRLDPKKEVTSKNLTEITNTIKNIKIFRLSSKSQAKDGFNIDKTYLDESHDINEDGGTSEIAEACWRGMSSKDEPLFINCTTQGFNRGCYLDVKIATAKRVIEGDIDDIHFLPFLYEQDSEGEIYQDEATWQKSNPSLMYGVKKIDQMRRYMETAKYDNGTRVHMLCKDFNIPQNTAAAWLRLEDYDYKQTKWDLEDFRDCICIAGVDLAETTDLTNLKLLFMRQGDNKKYIYSHYWIPESKLDDADDKTAGAKYKEWARDGYLTINEGNANDLTLVADYLLELKERYNIRALRVGYDIKYAKDFLNRLEEYGIDTEMIIQNAKVLDNPMRYVEADLKSRIINYNENPMDKWCLANAALQVDNLGKRMCVKINNQASKRIDGAVTLIITYETYIRYRTEFMRYLK